MNEPHRFRCGDTARIEGTDYDIEVAYANYESRNASWCGWPEGTVEIGKLTLVRVCSDEEHAEAVERWLAGRNGDSDHRPDVIGRLYRPRAYWRRVIGIVRDRIEQEQRALSGAEFALREAEQGPADVIPAKGLA